MTKTPLYVKGMLMRLSPNFENIRDFAYFVGGEIKRTHTDLPNRLYSVGVEETKHSMVSYFHGSYYALLTDEGKLKKIYPDDIEPYLEFDPKEFEKLPEGFDPQDSNKEDYGQICYTFKSEETYRLERLASKRRPNKLLKEEIFQKIAEHLPETITENLVAGVKHLFSVHRIYTAPTSEKFVLIYTDDSTVSLVRGFTVDLDDMKKFINREKLRTSPQDSDSF